MTLGRSDAPFARGPTKQGRRSAGDACRSPAEGATRAGACFAQAFVLCALQTHDHAKAAFTRCGFDLYLCGGEGRHGHVSDFWRLDLRSLKWTLLSAARNDYPILW
jgi:hypothetical protein